MPSPTRANGNTVIGRDATLFSIQNIPPSGTPPSAVSLLASWEKVDFSFKREYTSTMGASDIAETRRATHWGMGSVKLSGFMRGTASSYATLFASSSHGLLNFTEVGSGDAYSVIVNMEEFSKSVGGKDANKDSLTLPTEGVPYLNGTAMVLE